LLVLNKAAVSFNDVKTGPELYADITKHLKNLTGGMTVTLSAYNAAAKCMQVKHAEVDHTLVNDLFLALGRKRLTEVEFPISRELYYTMEKTPIWYYNTVHEATFGVIPKRTGKILQRMQNVDRFLGIAYFLDNELFGASMVALRKNMPDPPPEIIQSFAQMVALSLRRIRAEENLRVSEEKYRNIFNNAVEGIFQTTPDGRLSTVNTSLAEMLGYASPDEMIASVDNIGKQLYADPDDRKSLLTQLTNSGGRVTNFESRLTTREGSHFWVSINARLTQAEEGGDKYIEGTVIDITERKQARERIMKLNEELEFRVSQRTAQLEKAIKELEAFSYTVSHDLRAPVRAMNSFANILMEDYAPLLDNECQRLLAVIAENAKNMGRLIDDLLAFSQFARQEIKMTRINMSEIVQSVSNELCPEPGGDKISFLIKQMPDCFGDPSMLRQVWINMIGNAIKYSSRKSRQVIEVGSHPGGGECIYYVKDNGAGFDMAYADKLFSVFQRLHSVKDFEGTGLGLAIVHRIILRFNGRVWAEGKVGEGATFYFALPGKPLNSE
jgi:PAS domain S-box-containing protein